jgi:hypothetical protein
MARLPMHPEVLAAGIAFALVTLGAGNTEAINLGLGAQPRTQQEAAPTKADTQPCRHPGRIVEVTEKHAPPYMVYDEYYSYGDLGRILQSHPESLHLYRLSRATRVVAAILNAGGLAMLSLSSFPTIVPAGHVLNGAVLGAGLGLWVPGISFTICASASRGKSVRKYNEHVCQQGDSGRRP